jgi:ABC-2 type transport system permease protein
VIRLVNAELARLRARRMTLVVLLVLVAGLGLLLFGTNSTVSPPSAAEVAAAQQSVEQDRAELLQQCLDEGETQAACEQRLPTQADYLPPTATFGEAADSNALFGTLFAMLAIYLLAASAIGAEYGTGAIANWLTFVPERFRVLGAKLIAVAVAAVVVGVVSMGIAVGGTAVLVQLHDGTVAGVGKVLETAGRSVVLVVIAAVLGFCFALLTRHTGAAIGIILGYLVASFVLAGLAFALPVLAGLPPWLPDRNVTAFLNHGSTYAVYPSDAGPDAEPVEKVITFAHSAVYWAVLSVALIAVTATVFRRRDVT